MATKLKDFDWTAPSLLTTADKAVYNWAEWFDGDIWELTAGEDFQGHPLMMERIIRTRATSRQAKIRLRHQPLNEGTEPWGKIIVQRTDVVGPTQAKKDAAREKRAATVAAKNGTKTNGAAVKRPSKRAAAVPA
jgi:hypothetical protein